MTGWSHPRIANPQEAMRCWHDISHEATEAMFRRREAYPDRVLQGRMDKDEAAADIAAWETIAADWDWICTGIGKPAKPDSLLARTLAIDTAIGRFFQLIDRQTGALSGDLLKQGALLAAMRCWCAVEASDPQAHPRFLAGVGHSWRQANGHLPLGKMISAKMTGARMIKPQSQREARHAA